MITYPNDTPTLSPSKADSFRSTDRSDALSIEFALFQTSHKSTRWLVFLGAAFLVSVPVFFQAPLVRHLPVVSLVGTIAWSWLSLYLAQRDRTRIWGELLTGFTWTWLAGSLYWGWLRTEPTWHLPIEAIALPLALWGLKYRWCQIGVGFYLGSLLGTTVTDTYFYAVDLIPAWRQVMLAPEQAELIFRSSLMQMNSPTGWSWAIVLSLLLLGTGWMSLKRDQLPWIAFSGAVLSTLLVDGLFWIAARLA